MKIICERFPKVDVIYFPQRFLASGPTFSSISNYLILHKMIDIRLGWFVGLEILESVEILFNNSYIVFQSIEHRIYTKQALLISETRLRP